MSKKHKKVKKDAAKAKQAASIKAPKQKNFIYQPLSLTTQLITGIIFIALAFILYFQCLNYGFVLDDKIVFSGNEFTKKGFGGIWELFSTDSFQGYFGEQKNLVQGGRYRPLSLVTFAIEHEFWGLKSGRSHIINVFLYGLCAIISFSTLRLLFKEESKGKNIIFSISFLATLLFLVHPIHTEAVANIKGRDEIMSFIFSMLALNFAIKYFDTQKIKHLIIMFLTFLLGFFSKENTITFLAVIPFAILLFRQNDNNSNKNILSLFKGLKNKQTLVIILTLLVSSAIYLITRYYIMGFLMNDNPSTDIMNNPFHGLSSSQKGATIFYTLFVYLKLSFIPIELTHDYYPYHIPVSSYGDIIVIASILFNLLLVAAMLYCFNKNKWISFGIGFYFICLSIVSNVVIDVGTFMNERFIFTASLGLCIFLIAFIKWLSSFIKKGSSKWVPAAILLPIILLYSFKTIDRVPVWQNELNLNSAAIKVSKNSARSNSFMATALFNRYKETTDRDAKSKLLNEARPYAEKAVQIYPMYLNAHLMRAGIAAETYKLDGLLEPLFSTFKSIMYKRPDVNYLTTYLKYLNGRSSVQPELLAFYKEIGGNVLLKETKNYPWAVHYLQMALEISPNDPIIKGYLVQALTAMGRPNEAANYR